MPNIRVLRLADPEVRLCSSETEVPERGVAIVMAHVVDVELLEESTATHTAAAATELQPAMGWAMNGAEGFSDECLEVFRDGEFIGDLRTAEVTPEFAEIVYAPVP